MRTVRNKKEHELFALTSWF